VRAPRDRRAACARPRASMCTRRSVDTAARTVVPAELHVELADAGRGFAGRARVPGGSSQPFCSAVKRPSKGGSGPPHEVPRFGTIMRRAASSASHEGDEREAERDDQPPAPAHARVAAAARTRRHELRVLARVQRARIEQDGVLVDAHEHARLCRDEGVARARRGNRLPQPSRTTNVGRNTPRCAAAAGLRALASTSAVTPGASRARARAARPRAAARSAVAQQHAPRRDLVRAAGEVEPERRLEARDRHLVEAQRPVERVLAQRSDAPRACRRSARPADRPAACRPRSTTTSTPHRERRPSPAARPDRLSSGRAPSARAARAEVERRRDAALVPERASSVAPPPP
jgi:hypothetical protein